MRHIHIILHKDRNEKDLKELKLSVTCDVGSAKRKKKKLKERYKRHLRHIRIILQKDRNEKNANANEEEISLILNN
jgi:hypothetical protein